MWIEETVDRDGQQKLYVQIYHILKAKVEKGEWPVGSLIPSEDEFCKIFNVSKATIRLAVSELVKDGHLRRQQGKGTFVTYTIRQFGTAMKTRLTENIFGENLEVNKELLFKGVKEPPDEIRKLLMADGDTYCISCEGIVEGLAVYLDELFIPLSMLPGVDIQYEDICQGSFYDFIQSKAAKKIFKVVQTIEVGAAKRDAAKVLKMTEGSPVLLIHRIFLGLDGSPIACKRLVGNGTRYKFQTEFEKLR